MAEAGGILVINAGSSSIKFAVYGPALKQRLRGKLEGIGTAPRLNAGNAAGESLVSRTWPEATGLHRLLADLLDWIDGLPDVESLAAIGHRVATGGLGHADPALLTPAVIDRLRACIPLAPLHLPRNLEPIELLAASHPHLPQVACFDTAFHATLPPIARLYGLPRALTDAGAQRYGYHGLSYEYIAGRVAALDPAMAAGRTIVAHLGSGASLCALQGGRSIATTMGFSPLSGLVMGTRPGDLDAGLLIWLMRERGMGADELEDMFYHDAGLKGVSGITSDMRDLLASDDPRAAEAVALFVYKLVADIGALTATLGGLDGLVFTAGIGERSHKVRREVCQRLGWLGLRLDEAANRRDAEVISSKDSSVAVRVIPTDEECMVARHTAAAALEPQAGRTRSA